MIENVTLTNKQARQFLLLKHGLIGGYQFSGKQGVLDFIRRAGCIQYDPIDVCGKNSELVLQSRVKGFTKRMLYELLYTDRALVDYFDKNLAVLPVENWKYFERYRTQHRIWECSHDEINRVSDRIKNSIRERGPVCSADLRMNDKVQWYWSETKLSRAALEHLYFSGELAIHHKKGTVKYYDLIENCIPQGYLSEADPYPDEHSHRKWRVLRRIGAVGLLWNRASDAWLNIGGLKAEERNLIFQELQDEGKIIETRVDGIMDKFYYPAEDNDAVQSILQNPALRSRCELIAPLDNLLWDRRLIKTLFGFDYKWEIYTPEAQRKYGYYVLPLLYGDRFIGRAEVVNERTTKTLRIKNIWFESDVRQTKKLHQALEGCFDRFAKFNECAAIRYPDTL